MTDNSTPLLDVQNLSVVFGQTSVLKDINLTLSRDEVLGIVGETGAGKSVLARALIGMLPPGGEVASGDVKLEGRSISRLAGKDRRELRGGRIALIGTNAKALLDPVQTVGKQVANVLRAHRKCTKKEAFSTAIEIFRQVGIVNPEQRAQAYPHQLSGGMAQRVVIAMALIASPDIVLADDATLGLDATIQVQVLDLLINRCRELGVAAVIVTHDLGIVAQYCDRVAIMKDGAIIELKPVDEFLAAPQAEYSKVLLDSAKARPTPMSTEPEDIAKTKQPPLLHVDHVLKHFIDAKGNPIRAVDDVSFAVDRNQTLALVGESGSGKTTIGQCIVKLVGGAQGQVRFDGTDILPLSEDDFRPFRRRIQMVFQEPYVALNPRWSVESLISEPLSLVPELDGRGRSQRVRELLDHVGLPAKMADRYPHELTAGEQKRVGIARALSTRPDFVVFDEPTTALDIRVRAQIIDLIRDLQRNMGLSALFITHDLNSVRSLAHNVAVMRHGKIVERGDTESIFSSPKHEYTKKLLEAELPIEQTESQKLRNAAAVGGRP